MRTLLVARRVAEECLGRRELVTTCCLLGLGCVLAAASSGPDAESSFAAAVRGLSAAPILLVGASLLVLSRAWPSARRSNPCSRWLRVLPLSPRTRVLGPLTGIAAALCCLLVGTGILAGEFLAYLQPAGPPCREIHVLDPVRFTGPSAGRAALVRTLSRSGDGAVFEVPAGTRADRVTLLLRVYYNVDDAGSTRLRLDLGAQRVEISALSAGRHRITRSVEPSTVATTVTLERLSDEGPPVDVLPGGLRIRTPEERSLVTNVCAAFLSLLPAAMAAAATLLLVLPVLSRGGAIATAVLLLGVALAFPITASGIRIEDLGEGRWIGISGILCGHSATWAIAAAAGLLALLRRSP